MRLAAVTAQGEHQTFTPQQPAAVSVAVMLHACPAPVLSEGRNIACPKGTLHSN